MNQLEREYIAIGFDEDSTRIMPVIRMSGSRGLKKVIRGVGGIRKIAIYHVDFLNQTTENIGNVSWPDDALCSDVLIQYEPNTRQGTVRIVEADQAWAYSVEEARKPSGKEEPAASVPNPVRKEMVDKEKVRQLEEEQEVRILWPDELAEELKKEVFGQDEAIQKISEIIAAGLRRRQAETVVIVLFGPTGVGKTETGKTLPKALEKLTGQEYGFQQISMNQYVEAHSLQQWFGSPPSYVGYKDPTIFEPCRKNPYQVFLLDEIEDSTVKIWTGLMECFSNSRVKLQDNSPEIDLSHSIFILTSNVPIDMEAYNAASSFQKKEICRDAFTRTCGKPEIAGKIGNCLAFQALPGDAVTDTILKFVIQELENCDMELWHMDERLMVQMKEMYRNSRYGARSVRDAVRTALNFITYDRDLGKYRGKKVELSGDLEHMVIRTVPEDAFQSPGAVV